MLIKLQRLYQETEEAGEAFNATDVELARLRAEARRLTSGLDRARTALALSRDDAGRLAREQYQGRSGLSGYARFLLARDPQSALNEGHLMKRAARGRAETLARLTGGERRANALADAARRALRRQQVLAARQKKQRDTVRARLGEVEKLLASLTPAQLAALAALEKAATDKAQRELITSGALGDVPSTSPETDPADSGTEDASNGAQGPHWSAGPNGPRWLGSAEAVDSTRLADPAGVPGPAWPAGPAESGGAAATSVPRRVVGPGGSYRPAGPDGPSRRVGPIGSADSTQSYRPAGANRPSRRPAGPNGPRRPFGPTASADPARSYRPPRADGPSPAGGSGRAGGQVGAGVRGGVVRVARSAPSVRGRDAVAYAAAQIGRPYQWGAEGPASFDCSGLTSEAWARAGVTVPRTSQQQWRDLPRVPLDRLRPGDLVVYFPKATHVAIYLGDGMVIQAPRPGARVKVSPIAANPLLGAVRPDPGADPMPSYKPPVLPPDTDPAPSHLGNDAIATPHA
ncbi:NlpC/P60 family protein [Streptomyces sp. NPDC088261]|uniref:C40 family peptidase n=1 Tax=Streptomyces sp. NPDC088261 TaxID=3365851 RepID=UPI0038171B65